MAGADDLRDSPAGTPFEFRVLPDPEAVAREAASEVVVAARETASKGMAAVRDGAKLRGRFQLVLAGGSTPRRLYELLAREPEIDWSAVRLFWGDERCVPPDHADSNYRLAFESLISRIEIPRQNVCRLRGEAPDCEAAAREYEEVLRKAGGLDLVLLGVGEDGHTASIFPGTPAAAEESRWVVPARAPEWISPAQRLTLTLPAIATARRVLFLVTGESKREVVAAIRRDRERAVERYPAAAVRTREGVTWLLDVAAAGG